MSEQNIMPLIKLNEAKIDELVAKYGNIRPKPKLVDVLFEAQQSADLAVMETREALWETLLDTITCQLEDAVLRGIPIAVLQSERAKWAEEEADWLEKWAKENLEPIMISDLLNEHIAVRRKQAGLEERDDI